MIKFDKDKVMLLHQIMIEHSGGSAGVRDFDLLDSALESVYQTFGGVELYPTKEEKAARLGFNLISNHSFIDGNKRIGILVMLIFLEQSGVIIKATNREIVKIAYSIAEGKSKYEDLYEWIKKHKVLETTKEM